MLHGLFRLSEVAQNHTRYNVGSRSAKLACHYHSHGFNSYLNSLEWSKVMEDFERVKRINVALC